MKNVLRTVKAVVILWAVAVALASAAEVWETKPFPEWSDKDIEKLMNDSPWAGKASLTHAAGGGERGPVPEWKVIVAVRSALPIRQAFVRRSLGPGVAPTPEVEKILATSPTIYVIALGGFSRMQQMALGKAGQATVLKPKGKDPIPASAGSVMLLDKDGNPMPTPAPRGRQASAGDLQILTVAQRGGGGFGGGGGGVGGGGGFGGANDGSTAMLIVEFPKTTAITAADGEVEVATVVDRYNVKKTFKLKDMMFQGSFAF